MEKAFYWIMEKGFYWILGIIVLVVGWINIDSWTTLINTAGILGSLVVSTIISLAIEKAITTPRMRIVHFGILLGLTLIFATQLASIYWASKISAYSGALAASLVIALRETLKKRKNYRHTQRFRKPHLVTAFLIGLFLFVLQSHFRSETVSLLCLLIPLGYFYIKIRMAYKRRNRKQYKKRTSRLYAILQKLCHLAFSIGRDFHIVMINDFFYVFDKAEKRAAVTYQNYEYTGNYYTDDVVIPTKVAYGFSTYKVEGIERDAFSEYPVTSITIPEGVKWIRYNAFHKCTELTEITLPESLTTIESNVFSHCYKLSKVTIPKGVKEMDREAFYLCPKLESICFQCETPPQVKDNTFYLLPNDIVFYVPKGSKERYEKKLPWKKFNIVEME